jgi:hypothetical protein
MAVTDTGSGSAQKKPATNAERAQKNPPTDTESVQKNRKKPLQRCDQLNGDAELECLQKARERVVETRKKRETDATNTGAEKNGEKRGTGATNASAETSTQKREAGTTGAAPEKSAQKK